MSEDARPIPSETVDIAFVGGGLANTLAAVRLAMLRPQVRLAVIEAGPALGGAHTWSFHDTDVGAEQHAWLEPFIAHRWPRQEVRFPAFSRTLEIGYRSITSHTLHALASDRLAGSLVLGAAAAEVGPDCVRLADGRAISARAVIDGRGEVAAGALVLGWQKFVGREVLTAAPHGIDAPVIMDATVAQADGYRFVYLLPFAPDRILIEDTYYSDGPSLDDALLARRIDEYATARGWRIAETINTERGVLPIALGGDINALWNAAAPGVARSGLGAALFHPTTGYSLPDAVRLAEAIAGAPDLAGPALARLTREHSIRTWRQRGMFRFLNRMLFRAAAPDARWKILERFYRLPEGLVARFYADRLTLADRARLFTGKPPVPLGRALACLSDAAPAPEGG